MKKCSFRHKAQSTQWGVVVVTPHYKDQKTRKIKFLNAKTNHKNRNKIKRLKMHKIQL